MYSYLKKTLRLFVTAIVTFILTMSTMVGWKFWAYRKWTPPPQADNTNKHIVMELQRHVKKLSSDIGDRSVFNYKALKAAEDYIIGEFKSYGYKTELQTYMALGKQVSNIIAIKPGISKPSEIIILGAHYDTEGNPGADDNASGVAGLLVTAKLLSQEKFPRTIKFIAFVNEEPPYFFTPDMGSRVYAKKAYENKDDIKGAIILEMIGYYIYKPWKQRYPPLLGPFFPSRGNYIALISNWNSRRFASRIEKSFRSATGLPLEKAVLPFFVPGVNFSDHSSFWKYGYPAVMFTDTAFYRNHNYHRHTDTWETLDYPAMACFMQGLIPAVSESAH